MTTTSNDVINIDNLPDVTSTKVPEQKYFDDLPFPLILTPTVVGRTSSEWQQWVRDNIELLRATLLRYGAILFRGFSIDDPQEFDLFSKSFGWTEFPYVGGAAVRGPVVGNVYTANEAPPERKILFHHEMMHAADHPKVFFAYCDVAPPSGGETPLLLSNVVYRLMKEREPDFVERLAKEGLRYTRVAPEEDDGDSAIGRSWKSTYFADDRETAEKKAREDGSDVEWLPDGSMKVTSPTLSAVRVEPRTGKTTWFNSAYTCYFSWIDTRNDRLRTVLFPNGDQLPQKQMETLGQVMKEAAVAFKWQKGDVVMVDNELAQHARNEFTPPRRVLVSLFK